MLPGSARCSSPPEPFLSLCHSCVVEWILFLLLSLQLRALFSKGDVAHSSGPRLLCFLMNREVGQVCFVIRTLDVQVPRAYFGPLLPLASFPSDTDVIWDFGGLIVFPHRLIFWILLTAGVACSFRVCYLFLF